MLWSEDSRPFNSSRATIEELAHTAVDQTKEQRMLTLMGSMALQWKWFSNKSDFSCRKSLLSEIRL